MRFLKREGATVAFTVQETPDRPTDDLQFITDGVITLDVTDDGRTIRVPKFRGSATQSGEHAYRITDAGITVYPALEPGEHKRTFTAESISSGVPEIDVVIIRTRSIWTANSETPICRNEHLSCQFKVRRITEDHTRDRTADSPQGRYR